MRVHLGLFSCIFLEYAKNTSADLLLGLCCFARAGPGQSLVDWYFNDCVDEPAPFYNKKLVVDYIYHNWAAGLVVV